MQMFSGKIKPQSAGIMSIKKVTLPLLAERDELCLALSSVVRQWAKSAAKGIILFYTKLCFTDDAYISNAALINVLVD